MDVWDIEEDPVEHTRVTFKVDDDDEVQRPQLSMSLAEVKTMQAMRGGVSFENWLRLRGLDGFPIRES